MTEKKDCEKRTCEACTHRAECERIDFVSDTLLDFVGTATLAIPGFNVVQALGALFMAIHKLETVLKAVPAPLKDIAGFMMSESPIGREFIELVNGHNGTGKRGPIITEVKHAKNN